MGLPADKANGELRQPPLFPGTVFPKLQMHRQKESCPQNMQKRKLTTTVHCFLNCIFSRLFNSLGVPTHMCSCRGSRPSPVEPLSQCHDTRLRGARGSGRTCGLCRKNPQRVMQRREQVQSAPTCRPDRKTVVSVQKVDLRRIVLCQ